jgi:hypothetical protein
MNNKTNIDASQLGRTTAAPVAPSAEANLGKDKATVGETPPTVASVATVAVANDKVIKTLEAAVALKGHSVHRSPGGGFLASRCELTHHTPDLPTLQAFAKKVGVSA